jgi:protein-disulfide isomerase
VRSKGGGGGVRARQASPRALAIAGGVVAGVVLAIVLGVVLSRGHNTSAPGPDHFPATGSCHSSVALPGACEANALYKGIPQTQDVLGKPSAPVEMDMFIDVQCPICQNYEVSYLPTIVRKYIRTGKVQLHVLPWAFISAQSFTGRLGVIAASFQNKGLEYAKVLYDNQGQERSGWLTDTEMKTIAASVNGLDMAKWSADEKSSRAQAVANNVDKLAKANHVEGTPTVLIGCRGGKLRDIMPPGYAPNLAQTEQQLKSASCTK